MIEDGLAHLRDQLPWKVRVDPRQKHRGNDGPTLHLVRVHGSADSRGEDLRALCLQRSWTRRRWQPAAAGTEAGTIDSALEIGRASCRERVESRGGAGASKRKK